GRGRGGFEVPGGGFDWFGRAPADLTLTAYGLMESEDMARVHPVDPALITRTRDWLLRRRLPDGSWDPEGQGLHGWGLRAGGRDESRLAATAYIAWAVFARGAARDWAPLTLAYLRPHAP